MPASEWNFEEAARHAKGRLVFPDPLKRWGGASIDTRTLKTGDVFFALRGEQQDGHEFLWEAFRKGASGAVLRRDFFKRERERFFRERALFHNLLLVSDPQQTLAALAGVYRRNFSAVGVGITGSVGKTTTKEFVRFLLSQKYPLSATSGNLNNHLGLPLTLFQLQPEHQYCVAELGASHRGEIRHLSSLLRPRVGIVTGVSPVHLEGFGSLSHIYEAKLELADRLAQEKGVLILPDRDPELVLRARRRKVTVLLVGRTNQADFQLTGLKTNDGWIDFEVNGRWNFRFPGNAPFQVDNALAALAAAFACGISPGELPPVWKEIEFPKGRFEMFTPREGITFVNDCYNANPYSFEKALEAFAALERTGRKLLVFGDMLELGSEAASYHRKLGESIAERNFQALFTLGHWIRESAWVCEREGDPPLVLHFEQKEMLIDFLAGFLKTGDQVLFKGSRAMKLEGVLRALSPALSVKRASHSF